MLLKEIQDTLTDRPVTMSSKSFKTDCTLNKRIEQSAIYSQEKAMPWKVSVKPKSRHYCFILINHFKS